MIKLNFVKSFRKTSRDLLLLAIFWTVSTSAVAQHGHIYAGAVSQNPGSPLWFQNADIWGTNSYGGYSQSPACLYFESNIPDLYPGLYQTATTFAALPATIFTGGPSPFAASLGAFIELRFVSLLGPAGGALTVWNELDDPGHPAPMLTLAVGTTNGTHQIVLSEGDPSDPSSDPYGHIHGRRYTLNTPGLYTVGLQLIDTSSNGPNGGPIQSPSEITYFYLQAGLSLNNFSVTNNVAMARVGLPGLTDYLVEASPVIPATNWITITNIIGTSHSELRWVMDPNATGSSRFYRVRKSAN